MGIDLGILLRLRDIHFPNDEPTTDGDVGNGPGPWYRLARNSDYRVGETHYVGENDGLIAGSGFRSTTGVEFIPGSIVYDSDHFGLVNALWEDLIDNPPVYATFLMEYTEPDPLHPVGFPSSDVNDWHPYTLATQSGENNGWLPYTAAGGTDVGHHVGDNHCPPDDYVFTANLATADHVDNYIDWQFTLSPPFGSTNSFSIFQQNFGEAAPGTAIACRLWGDPR